MTTKTETTTVPADVTAFLTDLARSEAAPLTVRSYRDSLLGFARWFTGTNGEPFTAAAVTSTDIREFRAHLMSVLRRKPATVNRHLAALRAFGRWARGQRLIAELPTEGVKDVARVRQAPKALSKRDVDRVIKVAERRGKKRDIAILIVLRHTGVRVRELCALRVGDIDVGERKGTLTVRSGKGAKYRELPLNVDVRRVLVQYLVQRGHPRPEEPLFVSQKGGALTTRAVWEQVRNYSRQAGLEDVTPHTFRHSFGKHLLDAGESLVTVAAALGHANLNTTAVYTQPSARDLERALGRLAWEDDDQEGGR
jgi:integrase/recombinase XerD